MLDLPTLHAFIIRAKKATYVGDGATAEPSRTGSHDLTYSEGPYSYRDSYFGGIDFLGQEVVWLGERPVWAMNYHGYIIAPALITADQAGTILKAALSTPQSQGRLLDNFTYESGGFTFAITSRGTVARFSGCETIAGDGVVAYQLDYQGGLVME